MHRTLQGRRVSGGNREVVEAFKGVEVFDEVEDLGGDETVLGLLLPEIRRPTTTSGPTAARTPATTSARNRRRLAGLPPYSSVRVLTRGLKN